MHKDNPPKLITSQDRKLQTTQPMAKFQPSKAAGHTALRSRGRKVASPEEPIVDVKRQSRQVGPKVLEETAHVDTTFLMPRRTGIDHDQPFLRSSTSSSSRAKSG